jgi:hypothetical protein
MGINKLSNIESRILSLTVLYSTLEDPSKEELVDRKWSPECRTLAPG